MWYNVIMRVKLRKSKDFSSQIVKTKLFYINWIWRELRIFNRYFEAKEVHHVLAVVYYFKALRCSMFQIVKVQEKQIWPRTRASHHQDGGRFHEDRRRVCRVFRCGRREGPQPETGGGQQKEIRPQRWVINLPLVSFGHTVKFRPWFSSKACDGHLTKN